MSHPLVADGFNASEAFVLIDAGFKAFPEAEMKAMINKVKGIFQFDVKNKEGKVQSWTVDAKKDKGEVTKGASKAKPDVIISTSDDIMVGLADGKLNAQKAFMQGKIKLKGQMLLATKLDNVLKQARVKAGL
ncbi:sterol-binding-like protein [Conidiobolus coronatus NRRL 28638]|uniref:Sterol-binding-like protein n=1 Tax=Conidiobolus coronatus (strain ATCC 28846 / CBS 209.66 / NRRL 28638) TaxID=796925 RepID=A0A137P808_CONC2|nr:sterol-binding-like protein [Conidiobolus coronatus NRRL 28638]|eukprot:KXN71122.1 sterol-binding-like protein [Conidiobolus coronatus NRRL 28638]